MSRSSGTSSFVKGGWCFSSLHHSSFPSSRLGTRVREALLHSGPTKRSFELGAFPSRSLGTSEREAREERVIITIAHAPLSSVPLRCLDPELAPRKDRSATHYQPQAHAAQDPHAHFG